MRRRAVLQQIEELRRELNEQYRMRPVITPELVELSVRLDQLLNQLHHTSIKCNRIYEKCKAPGIG